MEDCLPGGYGAYIWASYVLTLFVVVVITVQARLRHRHVNDMITQRLRIEESSE